MRGSQTGSLLVANLFELMKILSLFLSVSIFSLQPAFADLWGNSEGYSITVNGVQKTFSYGDVRIDSSPSDDPNGYSIVKGWGWNLAQGGLLDSWTSFTTSPVSVADTERMLNKGGFPEYAFAAPWLLETRRAPGFVVSVPLGTGKISFTGTFSLVLPTVPPSTHYWSGYEEALGLGPSNSSTFGYGTKIETSEYASLGSGKISVNLFKPGMVVTAEDNSWSWRSTPSVVSFSEESASITRIDNLLNSGLRGVRAPVALTVPNAHNSYLLSCSAPIPWGWSGNVRISFTGFVADWISVIPTYREPYQIEDTWYPESWWKRVHKGAGMLPMTSSNGVLTFVKNPIQGSFDSASFLTPGSTLPLKIDFDVSR